MNHSSSVGVSIRATYGAIIIAKPVDIILGQPITKTTNILEQQLAQVAGAVPTHHWGGDSGCITLVLAEAEFWEATGVVLAVVDRQAKPTLVHPDHNVNSTHYKKMVKQEKQKEKIRDFDRQKLVDHLFMERIVGSVDPWYLEAHNK